MITQTSRKPRTGGQHATDGASNPAGELDFLFHDRMTGHEDRLPSGWWLLPVAILGGGIWSLVIGAVWVWLS